MKNLLFVISLFLISTYCFAQEQSASQIDSLIKLMDKNRRSNNDSIVIWGKNLLKTAQLINDDTLKYNVTRKLSYYFLRNRDFDSVKKYDDLLMLSAKKIDSFKVVSSFQNKAAYYNEIGQKDSAVYVLQIAKKIGYNNLKSETKEDSIAKIKSILFLQTAIVKNYFRDKEFEKALELTYSNLSTSNKYGITNFHAWNYFYLGLINLELNNYDEAEKYYRKELEYSKEQENPAMEGFALMHIGNVYYAKGNILKAENEYTQANKLFESINYLKGKLASKKKMFAILEEEKRFEEAIKIGESYIKNYLEKGNLDDYLSAFYIKIGRAYNKIRKFKKGNQYIDKGVTYANENPNENNVNLINQAYLAYKENDQYKTALEYHELLVNLKDSLLLNDKFTNQLAEANKKFETEKKEKQLAEQKIATQEQELLTQKANTRNWLLAIGLLALGISAFFIWRRYKSEAKAKQIISEQKTQIEKLQKEFHHRLKNDFRSINSYIGLVQRQFTDTNFKERLNELKNRVTSMFKVHEILLQEDDITQVKAHPYLLELSQNVEDKYNDENIKVICNVDKAETIVADKAITFGIVLNEFVTNSYKYAFDEKGGEINIDFKSDNDNHYLTLKDNGKGLPDDFDIESLRSLGMSIIPMFADLHDGSYQLDGSNGVNLTLTLPKKVA